RHARQARTSPPLAVTSADRTYQLIALETTVALQVGVDLSNSASPRAQARNRRPPLWNALCHLAFQEVVPLSMPYKCSTESESPALCAWDGRGRCVATRTLSGTMLRV